MSCPFSSLVRGLQFEMRTSINRMKCTFPKKRFLIVYFDKRTIVTQLFVPGNIWWGVSSRFNVTSMRADPQSRQRRLYSIISFIFIRLRKTAKFTMPVINILFVPLLSKCLFKLSRVFLRWVLYLYDIKIMFWERNTHLLFKIIVAFWRQFEKCIVDGLYVLIIGHS